MGNIKEKIIYEGQEITLIDGKRCVKHPIRIGEIITFDKTNEAKSFIRHQKIIKHCYDDIDYWTEKFNNAECKDGMYYAYKKASHFYDKLLENFDTNFDFISVEAREEEEARLCKERDVLFERYELSYF